MKRGHVPAEDALSQDRLAILLGLSRQRIGALIKKGLPRTAPAAVQWYISRHAAPAGGTKARRDGVALEREELELAQLKRTVVSVDEFTAALDEVYMRLNANLAALPKRLAARCAGKDQATIERLLEDGIEALKATLRKAAA